MGWTFRIRLKIICVRFGGRGLILTATEEIHEMTDHSDGEEYRDTERRFTDYHTTVSGDGTVGTTETEDN